MLCQVSTIHALKTMKLFTKVNPILLSQFIITFAIPCLGFQTFILLWILFLGTICIEREISDEPLTTANILTRLYTSFLQIPMRSILLTLDEWTLEYMYTIYLLRIICRKVIIFFYFNQDLFLFFWIWICNILRLDRGLLFWPYLRLCILIRCTSCLVFFVANELFSFFVWYCVQFTRFVAILLTKMGIFWKIRYKLDFFRKEGSVICSIDLW